MSASGPTIEAVRAFVAEAPPEPMMAVHLPHGAALPGRNRRPLYGRVLRSAPRSVLEVGCCAGDGLLLAAERGVSRLVGIEVDPRRSALAARAHAFCGTGAHIIEGRAESITGNERFDDLWILDVLHHVDDVAALLRWAADRYERALWIQFAPPWEPDLLAEGLPGPRVARRAAAQALARVLRPISFAPVAAIGPRRGHRGWYFSPPALQRLLIEHLRVARSVEIEPSPVDRFRYLARCTR